MSAAGPARLCLQIFHCSHAGPPPLRATRALARAPPRPRDAAQSRRAFSHTPARRQPDDDDDEADEAPSAALSDDQEPKPHWYEEWKSTVDRMKPRAKRAYLGMRTEPARQAIQLQRKRLPPYPQGDLAQLFHAIQEAHVDKSEKPEDPASETAIEAGMSAREGFEYLRTRIKKMSEKELDNFLNSQGAERIRKAIERGVAESVYSPGDDVYPLLQNINALSKGWNDFAKPWTFRVKSATRGFWNEEEDNSEMKVPDTDDDEFDEDDMTSLAHAKLEEHREYREYARLAVWDLPLLAKFARKFEAPDAEHVLKFRYTTYVGELHPADRKVVVEFRPTALGLTPDQELKLLKLAGPRYDPRKNMIKMSSERFEHQAQNKRYLGDLAEKLIAEAKKGGNQFSDIPLDLRHRPPLKKLKFPVEWRMTPERRAQLVDTRVQAYLTDKAKQASGGLVDGTQRIHEALPPPPTPEVPAAPAAVPTGPGYLPAGGHLPGGGYLEDY